MILDHVELARRFPGVGTVQPCSIDLHIDIHCETKIEPQEFRLCWTIESIKCPLDLCGFVHGKSSWARVGIQIHSAGLIDPGFEGRIVLEIVNFNRYPVLFKPNDPICQVTFEKLLAPVDAGYGDKRWNSQFQGQGLQPLSEIVGKYAERVCE